jgi:FMN reductase
VTARTIAVISAGLSQPSSTRLLAGKLAEATAGHLPAGTEVITIELRDLAHDIVNALLTGFPAPALREAIEQVVTADARCTAAPTTGCSSRSSTCSTRGRWRARRS